MKQQNQTTPTDAKTALDDIQKQTSLSYEDKEAIKQAVLTAAKNDIHASVHSLTMAKELVAALSWVNQINHLN